MPVPVVVFIMVAALVIILAVFAAWQERKRREAFQALAQRLGLRYTRRDTTIAKQYEFLDKLRQGKNRYALNILDGLYQGHYVNAFDYHYETESSDGKGHSHTQHHCFSFFILGQERVFPELRIYPESFLSRLGQALGYADIDFESLEFSRAFVVRSPDRKFAYDICHARMMEYLLQHRDFSLEIEGRCVALGFDKQLKPEEFEPMLARLVEVRSLFPEYLYQA